MIAWDCFRAGLLDELELQLMPGLLGQRRRQFEDMPLDHIEIELLRDLDRPDVLHLRHRMRSAGLPMALIRLYIAMPSGQVFTELMSTHAWFCPCEATAFARRG